MAAVLSLSAGAPAAGAPAIAQSQPAPGLHVVLVIDQSGSMWARNDPQTTASDGSVINPGWRVVAANLVAEWLGTDPSDADNQLSVIMFGTDAKLVFPLQDIRSAEAQSAFQKAMQDNNQYAGATDILEALQLAQSELAKESAGSNARRDARRDARRAVIFLSDGVCEPKPETSTLERQQCEQDIRQFIQQDFGQGDSSDPIYTIALTADAFRQSQSNQIYKNLWQEIAMTTGGDYYEPSRAEGELLPAVVSILQRLLGLPNQELPPPATAPAEMTVPLPVDLLQVGFTAVKYEPGIEMAIVRPDGSVVAPEDPSIRHSKSSLTESYRISQPASGDWTVKFTGRGKVILLSMPYARSQLTVDVMRPAAAHPQGKPMDIRVRVLGVDQAPLEADAVKADVILPDGTWESMALSGADGIYTSLLTSTQQAGAYALSVSGQVGDRVFSDTQSVKVLTAPWLKVIAPAPGSRIVAGQPISIQAQLMLGDQPLEQLADGERAEVIARLVGPDAGSADTQFLRFMTGGLYSGAVSADASVAGDFTLRVQLTTILASGERFEDLSEVALSVDGAAQPAFALPATTADIVPTAQPIATPAPAPEPGPIFTFGELTPIYVGLAGLGIILLLALVILSSVVGGIRRTYQQSLTQQNTALRDQRARDLTLQLQAERGWQAVAAQIVADALNEPAAIDGNLGILNATIEPTLRFTLTTHTGREVTFTTDPEWMKKAKLIHRGDRVIDVSEMTATSHTDANMLWYYVLSNRNMGYVTPPSYSHWYAILRRDEKTKGWRLPGGYSVSKRVMRQLPAPGGRS